MLNSNCTSNNSIANAYTLTIDNGYFGFASVTESDCVSTINPFSKREKMPEKAKTVMYRPTYGNMLRLKIADADGYVDRDKEVMPDFENVEVIWREFNTKVIVTFADNTKEIATLDRNDQFNIEQGIAVCITKKLLSDKIGSGYGSSVYNKLIDRGVKVFHKCEQAKYKKEAEEETKKRKYEKEVAKKKAKRMKREEEEREKQIEIQKEAILRALNQWNTHTAD